MAEKDATMSRITCTTQPSDLADVDFLIEAVVEDEDIKTSTDVLPNTLRTDEGIRWHPQVGRNSCVKHGIFLCPLCWKKSSISITKLAAATSRSSQVVGMHFSIFSLCK